MGEKYSISALTLPFSNTGSPLYLVSTSLAKRPAGSPNLRDDAKLNPAAGCQSPKVLGDQTPLVRRPSPIPFSKAYRVHSSISVPANLFDKGYVLRAGCAKGDQYDVPRLDLQHRNVAPP